MCMSSPKSCPIYPHTHTHTHSIYIYTYTYIHTYICNILDEYVHIIHTCFVLYHEGVVVVEGLPLFGVDHFGQRQNVRLYASKCMLEFMHVSYVYVCIIHLCIFHTVPCIHTCGEYVYIRIHTLMSHEEEDTCMPHEEDTCM